LRDGAQWSWVQEDDSPDGPTWRTLPVVADDVVYTWTAILASPESVYHSRASFLSIVRQGDDPVSVVVEVGGSAPTVSLSAVLAHMDFPIVPDPGRTQTAPGIPERWGPGSGPYQPTSISPGRSANYTRNPYYAATPELAGDVGAGAWPSRLVIVAMRDRIYGGHELQRGWFDVITSVPLSMWDALERHEKVAVRAYSPSGFTAVGFNTQKMPKTIRRAVTHSVDRGALLRDVYPMLASAEGSLHDGAQYIVDHPYPPLLAPDVASPPYDPDRARQTAIAGERAFASWREGRAQRALLFVMFGEGGESRRVVEHIRQQVVDLLGVPVQVYNAPTEAEMSRTLTAGQFDLFYHHWAFSPTADTVSALFGRDSRVNYTGYNVPPSGDGGRGDPGYTPDLDRLLTQYDVAVEPTRVTTQPDRRLRLADWYVRRLRYRHGRSTLFPPRSA
jgi:hypothetical protein